MAVEEVPEVLEVNYNGTVIDFFKIVNQCMLYSCVCCVLVVVGVILLVSFTNIVTRI
jgi:cell division protein FtsX